MQFTSNCYRHWATLVGRDMDGSGHLLHIKICVTKGYLFAMNVYVIGILLLVCEICTAHPHVMKLWYMDNAGTRWTFDALREHIRDFLMRGTPQGYFLYPTNSVLVVYPRNVQRMETHFRRMGVHVVTGRRHLGIFIGKETHPKSQRKGSSAF